MKSAPRRCAEEKRGSENKVRASVTHNTLDRDNGGPDTDPGEFHASRNQGLERGLSLSGMSEYGNLAGAKLVNLSP
jgi:hypothetical protein